MNGKTPDFKNWDWLDPAGGLLTTVHDLAQVNVLSDIVCGTRVNKARLPLGEYFRTIRKQKFGNVIG